MRVSVRLLRQKGRPLPWREIAAVSPVVGELTSYYQSKGDFVFHVATVRPVATPAGHPLLPPLYEPVLVAIGPMGFRLRGFERVEHEQTGAAVVQEWICDVAQLSIGVMLSGLSIRGLLLAGMNGFAANLNT